MDEREQLLARFEECRPRLRSLAYRMLGSIPEADDAVQDAWLRVERAEAERVDNLDAWLTTVVARVCLNQLRSRQRRREEPLEIRVPDPIIDRADGSDPEYEALLADSVGLALQVVLEALAPAERLAFVLHDMFGVPFDHIAPMIDRSSAATRQLASRARRRVRDQAPPPDVELEGQREVVDAFLAASREGDFDALVAVLHPDVVLRADGGRTRPRYNVVLHGAGAVAGQAVLAKRLAPFAMPALVNGTPGVVSVAAGRALSVMGFTVRRGKVVAIDVLVDPDRLAELDLTRLGI